MSRLVFYMSKAKFIADDILNYLFTYSFILLFQRKQVLSYHVNRLPDDSHEMSRLVFSEKKKIYKKKKMSAAVVIGALNLKMIYCLISLSQSLAHNRGLWDRFGLVWFGVYRPS